MEGDSWGLAALLTFSAAPAVASGDLAEGARRYGEALGLYTELGTVWMTAQALLGLANTAGLAQRWERSVRLYAAAETLGRAMGRGEHEVQQGTNRAYAVLGHDRGDLHEQDLADAREALGDGLFEDVWRQGRELSFDEALHDAIAVAAELVASRRGAANDRAPLLDLTPRERQVLALLGEGRANKEMAQGLRLSVRTIENHLAHIYLKLNVQGRVEAALLAQSMGVAGPA